MKRTLSAAALFFASVGVIYAHGGNEHVRGTVKELTATAITVQTTGAKTATITLNDKTMFMKSGKHVTMSDLKLGERVVVDVDAKDHVAESVTFGVAPATPKSQGQAHK